MRRLGVVSKVMLVFFVSNFKSSLGFNEVLIIFHSCKGITELNVSSPTQLLESVSCTQAVPMCETNYCLSANKTLLGSFLHESSDLQPSLLSLEFNRTAATPRGV